MRFFTFLTRQQMLFPQGLHLSLPVFLVVSTQAQPGEDRLDAQISMSPGGPRWSHLLLRPQQ